MGRAMKSWTLFLVLCMLAVPGMSRADEDDVYESMYGSAASLYSTGYGIAFDALKEGQRLEPYIDKINKIAGFAATVGSATRKAASGDMYGAGEESVLAIMAEVAGWESSGQAYLKYLGLSTATFQLALTAYSITKESYAQVESTRIARDIESLYGAIESDPVLKPRTGRQLGDKSDPIPVTKQSVEYVFRKVVQDTSWRNRLKAYVSEELGREFPEPSFWDNMSAIAVDGGRGYDTAGQAEGFKNRQEIETWIAGLLKRLNDYARAAESEVIMRKAFFEIEKASRKLTPEFQKFAVSVEEAIKRLPEINAYAKQVPQTIANAKKNKKWDDLYNIRDRIGYFVRVYVRILPDKGDIGKKKQETKAVLKQSWSAVASALKDIPKTIQNEFTVQTSTSQYKTSLPLTATPANFIGIDEADMQIRQAKTIQEAERLAEGMTKDAAGKWQAFQDRFAKENPPGKEHPQYKSQLESINAIPVDAGFPCDHKTMIKYTGKTVVIGGQTVAETDQSAYINCVQGYEKALGERRAQKQKQLDDLEKEVGNYNQKRKLYQDSVEQQYYALVRGIGKLTEEKRTQYADMENLKKGALDKVAAVDRMVPASYPNYPVYPPPMNYNNTAAGAKQLLNGLRSMKTDGYLGLPKMKFPKWGENGAAVANYIEGIKRKIANESNSSYQTNENHRHAMEYIGRLKKHLVEKGRYEQEVAEAKERIQALNLQSDPKARVLTDIEKRVADMKDVEKLALAVEVDMNSKVMADNQKQLASIQDDLLYLDSLLRKVRYWQDAFQEYTTSYYKFGGSVNAAMVSVAMATEGSSGSNRRTFLAPSPSDLSLFDKAKANAAADALLKDVALTGIAKWDPSGDTGLKAMLEKKAAEMRNYYIDSSDYAIVNGNVVYAARIAKMAADVKAIPTSSYGSYTYKEGIRNRTFDEKLGAALRNGTAFAMDIEMKTNADEQSVSVALDTAKGLAANHRNAAIKTASSDLVKAVDEHVKRYNAHTAQEAKQRAIDYAKAEAEMKLQTECLTKGGRFVDGKCITTTVATGPGQTGRSGQTASGPGAGTPPASTGPMMPPAGQSAGTSPQSPGGTGPTIAPPAGQSAGTSPQSPGGTGPTIAPPAGQSAGTSPQSPGGTGPTIAPPAGTGSMAARAGTSPTAPPQGQGGQAPATGQPGVPPATPPAAVQMTPSQSGASAKPQTTPPSGPAAGQPGQSAPPAGPPQGTTQVASPAGTGKAAPAGTVSPQPPSPPQGASSQAASPAKVQPPVAGSGTPPQRSASPQPKTGAASSMPSQTTSAQQPKTGATGSMPQQSGMGPMASLQSKSSPPKAVDLTPKVRELYSQLKQAYESKSTSGVARCLSSQWGSSDGGSVSDLQRNLQKIFTMFDEVRFNIQNLQVNKVNEGKYKVSYDVTITSKIYKKNLKHEEKSSINEEVTIDQSGQPKISRTLGGKLLSVK
jgi:hypothetical protein